MIDDGKFCGLLNVMNSIQILIKKVKRMKWINEHNDWSAIRTRVKSIELWKEWERKTERATDTKPIAASKPSAWVLEVATFLITHNYTHNVCCYFAYLPQQIISSKRNLPAFSMREQRCAQCRCLFCFMRDSYVSHSHQIHRCCLSEFWILALRK